MTTGPMKKKPRVLKGRINDDEMIDRSPERLSMLSEFDTLKGRPLGNRLACMLRSL